MALPSAIAPDAPTPLWRALDAAMDGFGDDRAERPESSCSATEKIAARSASVQPSSVRRGSSIARAKKTSWSTPSACAAGARVQCLQESAREWPWGDADGRSADPGLARVAQETGGELREIRAGQDLGAAFARVADELHGQYLIGFAPPKRDGKVHDIDVRVTQRGLTPRARKSYVAPK